MLQTLFHIPTRIGSVELLGLTGLLFWLWIVVSVVMLWRISRQHGWGNETMSFLPIFGLVAAVLGLVLPAIAKESGLPIQGYGAMLLVAIVTSVGIAIYRGRARRIDADSIISLAIWAVIPGILGGRAFFVIQKWDSFQEPTFRETLVAILKMTEGGLVVYGAIIGGMLGLLFYLYRNKLPILRTFDLLAPTIMIGLGIGRIGCLLNGCCFGGPCDLPWAITFPPGSYAHLDQLEKNQATPYGIRLHGEPGDEPVISSVESCSDADHLGVKPGQKITGIDGIPIHTVEEARARMLWAFGTEARREASSMSLQVAEKESPLELTIQHGPDPLPVHPTQLYSTLNGLLLGMLLLMADRWLLRRDGQVFALMITLYPVSRFLIEMIRTDEAGQFGTGLTISQLVSIGMIGLAVLAWAYTSRLPKRELPVLASRR